MKRFNKFLALFLAVVMTVGLLPAGVSAASEVTSFVNEDFEGKSVDDTMRTSTGSGSVIVTDWAADSNTVISKVAQEEGGNKYLAISPGLGQGRGKVNFNITDANSVKAFEAGQLYRVSVDLKKLTDNTSIGIEIVSGGYTTGWHYGVAKQFYATGLTTEWKTVESLFVPNSDVVTSIWMNLTISTTTNVGTLCIDNIKVEKVETAIEGASQIILGNTEQMSVSYAPALVDSAAVTDIAWESANEGVATVDAKTGIVTPVNEGTATIKATVTVNRPIAYPNTDPNEYKFTLEKTVKVISEISYDELVASLSSSNNVQLSTNVTAPGNDLVLKSGKTLDLNGKTLTVDSLAALNGANVIDSVGGGMLIAKDGVSLDKNNTYVPVKDGDGYVFYQAFANNSEKAGLTAGANSLTYADKPTLKTNEDSKNVANALFADGAADNGISLVYRLSWTVEGKTVTMDVALSDAEVKEAHTPNAEDQYSLIKLTATNVVDGATVSTVLVSDLGVEYVVNTATYTAVTE